MLWLCSVTGIDPSAPFWHVPHLQLMVPSRGVCWIIYQGIVCKSVPARVTQFLCFINVWIYSFGGAYILKTGSSSRLFRPLNPNSLYAFSLPGSEQALTYGAPRLVPANLCWTQSPRLAPTWSTVRMSAGGKEWWRDVTQHWRLLRLFSQSTTIDGAVYVYL